MSLISELVVNLKGNTGPLDTALDRSGKRVGDFASKVNTEGGKASSGLSRAMNNLPGPLGRVSSLFGSIGSEAGGLTSGLGLVAGGFVALTAAVVAAGAALVVFGLKRQGEIEQTSRMADELGLSYNGLVGLQHAAEQTGVSTEALDSGLRRLTEGISGAAHGTGEARAALSQLRLTAEQSQKAFGDLHLNPIDASAIDQLKAKTDGVKLPDLNLSPIDTAPLDKVHDKANATGKAVKTALGGIKVGIDATGLDKVKDASTGAASGLAQVGISAAALNNLSPDKQLDVIADALSNVKNQGDRLRLATELFGREAGPQLANMLSQGSAGLAKFKDEAKSLGLFLSKDQIKQVEQANAAWKRMGDAWKGVGNTMAVLLAPVVEKVTGVIQWMFQGINDGINAMLPYWKLFSDAVQAVGNMISDMLQPVIQGIMSIWDSWMGQLGASGITWENAKKVVVGTFTTIQYAAEHWRDVLSLAWDETVLGFSRFVTSIEYAFTDTLPAIFNAFGDFAGTFFSNLGKNISENWDQIWLYLKTAGKEGGNLVWHNLAEGWDNAIKKVQAKSTAPLTDFEKKLNDKIKGESAKLGQGWWDAVTQKWKDFNKEEKKEDDKSPEKGKSEVDVKNKNVAAAEKGSAEAFKIIAGAQGDKMYTVANANLKEAREHNKKLDKLLNQLAKPQIQVAHLKG